MAAQTGSAVLGYGSALGSGTIVFQQIANGSAANTDPASAQTYLLRQRDNGLAGVQYVTWVSGDPTSSYPGVPVGSLSDKSVAKIVG